MNPLQAELLDMLSYCRPRGSATERAFIDRYIAPLPTAYEDVYGNWHCTIGESTILWSSHTDTVHRSDGRQTVHFDPATGIVQLSKRARKDGRNCLGADCTAGVFIMRQMILRGIPGHYIFHYGEESGGIGSHDLADECSEWLATMTHAIALDRRGTSSVITWQGWRSTASDLFALSLALELLKSGLSYDTDPTGVYTDTVEYADMIPECSNLSVGYAHEHTPRETLDCTHVLALLDALCAIDVSQLAVERDPAIDEWDDLPYSWQDEDGDRYATIRDSDGALMDYAPIDLPDLPSGVDAPFDLRPCYARDKRPERDSMYLDPEYGRIQRALTLVPSLRPS